MNRPKLSAKRIALDKANAQLLVIISVAIFFVIFSTVAIKALYSQMTYQTRVIDKKEATLELAKQNIDEVQKLNLAYTEFSSEITNAIGGNPKGAGDRDGENARIILDALPSKYDYPALNTSLDKLAKLGGFQLTSITGTDDEVNQSTNQTSAIPEPVDMPFTVQSNISNGGGTAFMQLFEKSIRPIQVQKLSITGKDNQLEIVVTAKTYFKPEKKLNITKEEVK